MKKNAVKNKRVKTGIVFKMLAALIPVIIAVIVIILLLVYSNTSRIISEKSEELLSASTGQVIRQAEGWMKETLTALEMERDTLQYFAETPEEEQDYVKHTANMYDSFPTGIYFATTDGTLVHSSFVAGADYNALEKGWYKDGIESDDFKFGEAYVDEDSQSYVVGVSGQLKDASGKVRGVAAADVSLDAVSDIVKEATIGNTGKVFLIDGRTDMIIGHTDSDMLGKKMSELQDGMYSFIYQRISDAQTGLTAYDADNGDDVYLDIENVPESDWIAVSYVPKAEVLGDLNTLTQKIIAIAVISILILSLLILLVVKRMVGKPVKELDYVARKIADGDLNTTINHQSNDELGELASNFKKTVLRLREYVDYIDEITKVLQTISNGDLNFQLTQEYVGDFAKIKVSLIQIADFLNETLGQINQSANEVNSGAEQMADGAQTLSQGATAQASDIQELASTINKVAQQMRSGAKTAQNAKDISSKVGNDIKESNSKMADMTSAMQNISNKSSEISKIIKTIEDIAFQTNILALNAAVEAARAGEAGKGFAVVADEVRNLANKSSEAAQNTAALIEETVDAVGSGTAIANDTAKYMTKVVGDIEKITLLIEDIAQASMNQAGEADDVTAGIDRISGVVHTNSATAQESAAASEELSGQAQMLKELVDRFRLKQ